jgi:hypothetical protein
MISARLEMMRQLLPLLLLLLLLLHRFASPQTLSIHLQKQRRQINRNVSGTKHSAARAHF